MSNEPPSGPPWTILKLLRWTTSYFQNLFKDDPAAENPRVGTELLLAHSLGCRRLDLYLRYDQPLNEVELARFRQLVKRRAGREPVAYILGQKEFWSLDLVVTPDVLIPRPDTESLVEAALSVLPDSTASCRLQMLELGVGSGAVSIALAKERPDLRVIVTDISWAAIAVARQNAQRHNVAGRIEFIVGNWLDMFRATGGLFNLIVSNPPYIATADLAGLSPDIYGHEPMLALDGGKDGLQCLAHLIRSAPGYLLPGGHLACEIGFDQKRQVESLARQCDPYDHVTFRKDDAGHHRVVVAHKRIDG